ncbi:MAG: hypothetical protein WDN46_14200 [Methylocella sp.]
MIDFAAAREARRRRASAAMAHQMVEIASCQAETIATFWRMMFWAVWERRP